jgi:hypothetical protein
MNGATIPDDCIIEEEPTDLWVDMSPEDLAERHAELACPDLDAEPGAGSLSFSWSRRSLSVGRWAAMREAYRRRVLLERRRAAARAGDRRARRRARVPRRSRQSRRPPRVAKRYPDDPAALAGELKHRAAAVDGANDPKQLPYLLLPREAAALLRMSLKALYARIERGLLPGVVRDGRRVLVLRDELLKSLEKTRAASPGGRR